MLQLLALVSLAVGIATPGRLAGLCPERPVTFLERRRLDSRGHAVHEVREEHQLVGVVRSSDDAAALLTEQRTNAALGTELDRLIPPPRPILFSAIGAAFHQ